MNDKNSQKLFR